MSKQTGPAWGYKLVKGAVEAKLFVDGKIPRGWHDTPANLKGAKDGDDA